MALFSTTSRVVLVATVLRLVMLIYGGWQDANSAMKYTDIDYMVFTDAARYVSKGESPYSRDTYRYTPLLSWMLVPTTWEGSWSALTFAFGKILFALADVLAGWLVVQLLTKNYKLPTERTLRYVAIAWLWNPMVANISTRGSSEGLLGVLVAALLWATLARRAVLAGFILGLAVHFKIYPFIYGVSILWWWDAQRDGASPNKSNKANLASIVVQFITISRIKLVSTALVTFAALNFVMYLQYGMPFLQHTFFHHVTRIDHRHNFSPYSTLLYLTAAGDTDSRFEALAFLPQLILAVIAIPLVLAKKNLTTAMLAQTFAFVTFNKVCTSQYFLWYLILLPFYLPSSSLIRRPILGISAAFLWVLGQALWLSQGYNLEFLGLSAFVPGLFLASLSFFAINVWILGIIVRDGGQALETDIKS